MLSLMDKSVFISVNETQCGRTTLTQHTTAVMYVTRCSVRHAAVNTRAAVPGLHLPKQRDSHDAPLVSMETLFTPCTPCSQPAHPVHPVHTLFTSYSHPVHILFTPCTPCSHPIHTLHTLHTLFTPCSHPIHTLHTLFTPYSHPIHTLHTLFTPCTPCSHPAHPYSQHVNCIFKRYSGPTLYHLTTILRPNRFRVLLPVSIQCYF